MVLLALKGQFHSITYQFCLGRFLTSNIVTSTSSEPAKTAVTNQVIDISGGTFSTLILARRQLLQLGLVVISQSGDRIKSRFFYPRYPLCCSKLLSSGNVGILFPHASEEVLYFALRSILLPLSLDSVATVRYRACCDIFASRRMHGLELFFSHLFFFTIFLVISIILHLFGKLSIFLEADAKDTEAMFTFLRYRCCCCCCWIPKVLTLLRDETLSPQ